MKNCANKTVKFCHSTFENFNSSESAKNVAKPTPSPGMGGGEAGWVYPPVPKFPNSGPKYQIIRLCIFMDLSCSLSLLHCIQDFTNNSLICQLTGMGLILGSSKPGLPAAKFGNSFCIKIGKFTAQYHRLELSTKKFTILPSISIKDFDPKSSIWKKYPPPPIVLSPQDTN